VINFFRKNIYRYPPEGGGKKKGLAAVYVFNDDAGCGAFVSNFFNFVNVFAEATFVVFSYGCNSIAGILENFGQSLITKRASCA
jgi:hypothetical protein